MKWTDERIELLKKLHAEGHSGTFIAESLGSLTRNAVIGKIHRLGLAGRSVARPPRVGPRPKTERPKRHVFGFRGTFEKSSTELKDAPPQALDPPPESRIQTLNLKSRHCRWPIGDPRSPGFGFCGEKAIGTFGGMLPPYCERHARMAYMPSQVRRRVWC